VRAAVPPGLAGDLATIASSIPGVTPISGGISVLGLGADQNRTTLNGMSFAGTDVPRDAKVSARVSVSTYDPSRGWFGGAEQSVELEQGQLFSSTHSHITIDAPFLQYGDAAASAVGARFSNLTLSLGGTGMMDDDKWAFNYGAQGGRRWSGVAGIENADVDVLRRAGVPEDSLSRFLQ